MNIVEEIKYTFSSSNAVRKIILINVVAFIAISLVNALLFLLNDASGVLAGFIKQLMLPASFRGFIKQPWSIITYMFLHEGFLHILFNMLWLFWLGSILHEYLGNKKVYQAYFGGGIFGGVLYMVSYNVFPLLNNSIENSFALGASAGVLSIIVATATLLPEYSIQLFFIGAVRLKWLALATVVLDMISIPSGNAGGHLAHLGGALFGFLYIKYLYQKNVLPTSLTNLFKRKSKLKIHYKTTYMKTSTNDIPSEEDVNAILDKISKTGYDSLSKKEKELLFKASKD
jgi:membrane associated rhomboid family serine protease